MIYPVITPCTCTRGKVISSVIVVVIVNKNHQISASRPLVTRIKTQQMLNLPKNWLHLAMNRVVQPTNITNSVYLLAIVATPIDHAHY